MRPSGPVTGAPTVSREPVSRPHCTGQITRRNGIIRIPGRFALPAARSAVACPPHPGHFSAPSEQVPIRQEHTVAHSGRDNDLSADGESKRKNAGCDASLAYRLFRNEKGPAQGRARVLLHRVRPSDRHTRCPSRPTGPSTLRRTVSGPDRGWPVSCGLAGYLATLPRADSYGLYTSRATSAYISPSFVIWPTMPS